MVAVLHFFHYMFIYFNDSATTDIYTLSLHDALPISIILILKVFILGKIKLSFISCKISVVEIGSIDCDGFKVSDRKSTRLNSSHVRISYAVFCLKKKIKMPESVV